MLVAIVALLLIFGIPLSAIIGGYMVKLKKMELESGGGAGTDVLRKLAMLEAENRDLKSRVEVLETIVTSDDAIGARSKIRVDAGARDRSREVSDVEAVRVNEDVKKAGR
jgi:hypothetical protein